MNYNEESFFDKLKDEKYKSKFMLIVFVAILFLMILYIRINAPSVRNNAEDNKVNNDNNSSYSSYDNNDASFDDVDDINLKFIYLLLNNYEFNFKTTFGGDTYYSSGRRIDNDYVFNFVYGDEKVNFYAENDHVKMIKDDKEELSRYPYFFINYFNNEKLVNLIKNSKYSEEDNKYHISNEILYNLGDREFTDFKLEDPSLDNTIELKEINGKVVGIKMDFSNLYSSEEVKLNTLIIELNYSNFGFVEELESFF